MSTASTIDSPLGISTRHQLRGRKNMLEKTFYAVGVALMLVALPAKSEYHLVETCVGTGTYRYPTCSPGNVCAAIEIYNCSTTVVEYPGGPGGGDWEFPGGFEGGGGPGETGGSDSPLADPCDVTASANAGAGPNASAPKVELTKGNPIDINSGMKVQTDLDFRSEGQVPLMFQRQYRSLNANAGMLGRHWESNFDFLLIPIGTTELVVRMPGRGNFSFVLTSTPGVWASSATGVNAQVVRQADGSYTLTWVNDSIQRYDANGKPLSVKNPQGLGYDFSYDAYGKLNRVTATGGRFIQFSWTGTQLTSVTDPAGNVYTYSYLANRFGTGIHLLSTVKFPGQSSVSVTYHYESPSWSGALTGKTFGSTRFSWFTYDSQGRATSTEHRVGTTPIERYAFTYANPDANTRVVSETNPLGKQSSYRFVNGELESVTGLPSASCPASLYTRTRDANGRTDVVTDFNNRQTDLDFDAQGHQTKAVLGFGSSESTTITQQWEAGTDRLLNRTVVGDHSKTYSYDSLGRVVAETITNLSANGVPNQSRVTAYSYGTPHSNGLQSSVTEDGPLPGSGDAVTSFYSATGDLLSVNNALGAFETYSGYNGLGLPARIVYATGTTVDLTYDNRGRVLTRTQSGGGQSAVTSQSYDLQGRVTAINAPGRPQTSLTYDSAGRLTSATLPETISDPDPTYISESLDSNWYYSYNANSDRIQDRVNRKYSFSYFDEDFGKVMRGGSTFGDVVAFRDYDEMGRLKAARGNHGQNKRFGYDESGNLVSVTDSLNNVVTFEYDAQNRLKSQTDAAGTTRISYDAFGRPKQATDARGLVTDYVYDGFGQLLQIRSRDSGTTSFSYDSYGRLGGLSRADFLYTSFTHDSMGRITAVAVGFDVQYFSYDSCSNGKGRLCVMTDSSGSTSYAYTVNGQVSQQVNTIAGASYTTSYTYDGLGRATGITYPDGKTATYSYADGFMRAVSAAPNGVSVSVVSSMQYQPFGPLTSLVYGNGVARVDNFDNDGRRTSSAASSPALVQGLSYSWDSNNRITTITNGRNSALNQTYGYDAVGRLSSVGRGDGVSESYSFDSVGNRTSQSIAGVTTNYTYGNPDPLYNSNRLYAASRPGASRVWTYDANGNSNGYTGEDGVAVGFHYDSFGRIDSSSRNSQTTSYLINGLGQRVSKNGPNGATRFIYSPDGSLLAEFKVGTGWTDYIRSAGELVGLMRGGALYFVHNDHTGRLEVVTNSAKAVVWAASNYAYDRVVTTQTLGELNIGLPGQYFDTETKSWYSHFRDFDSTTGRYLQTDPIGLGGGMNTYAYVGGNPVNFVDPDGRSIVFLAGCALAAWGGYDATIVARQQHAEDIQRSKEQARQQADAANGNCDTETDYEKMNRQNALNANKMNNRIAAYGGPAIKAVAGVLVAAAGGGGIPGAVGGVLCTVGGIGYGLYKGSQFPLEEP